MPLLRASAVCVLLVLLLPPGVGGQQLVAKLPACVVADTTLPFVRWPTAATQVPRPVIDSLERAVASSPPDRMAELLYQLGHAKALTSPDSLAGDRNPDEFFRDGSSNSWWYNGRHFDELVRRYPQSDYADDALYEKALLPRGGECEGFTACYVDYVWRPIARFLREYPSSPFVDQALQRVLFAFSFLKHDMNLVRPPDEVELNMVVPLVAALDSVALLQRPDIRAVMQARAGELWEQLGNVPRARLAYSGALANTDERALRSCITARMQRLSR